VDIDVFERTWRINCGSAYLLTQLCMPAMEEAGWGRVVFVSSVAGLTGGIIGPHYAYVRTLCSSSITRLDEDGRELWGGERLTKWMLTSEQVS
jgi:NAD(P)-dependent dehydrogenase (short-subunit alcohol dehydrogenase family)